MINRKPRGTRLSVAVFFLVLFLALALLYSPSFANPPRSDHWSALYVFHQIAASDAPLAWMAIVNHDPWQDGTYRPLAHLLLYFQHLIFGAGFFWNHIVNFAAYFFSIVLLYRLAREFGLPRLHSAAFLTVYAFLFSHFDIVSWTFHFSVIAGFCAFLAGFILYLDSLRTGRLINLPVTGGLFLFGLWCYEGYALWPLALLILGNGRGLFSRSPRSRYRGRFFLPAGVYALYLAGFVVTRTAEVQTGSLPDFSAFRVLLGVCAPFFNLVYNGLLVNVCPFLATPLRFGNNVEMGGLLARWDLPFLTSAVTLIGGGVGFLLLVGLGFLSVKKHRELAVIAVFLLFLNCTFFLIAALARISTNDLYYPLVQFRYQYVPNALLVLLVLVAVVKLLNPGRRGTAAVCCLLVPVLAFNILLTRSTLKQIEYQLAPLRELIANLRLAIDRGIVSEREKLYIDEGITFYYYPLAWNLRMAAFFPGTYQWIFSARDIGCFAFTVEEAGWIIDADLGEYRNGYWQPWIGRRNLDKGSVATETKEPF